MSNTKDYIVDQAYRLFLTKSYEAVSISDISEAIGLTKGALYHHFVNKEDLFRAVIDKYLSVIGMTEIREGISLAEFIDSDIEYVRRIVNTICVDRQPFVPVSYLSLLIDALRHYPGFADNQERYFTRQIDKLRVIIENAIAAGEVRADADPHVAALNFFSISVGVAANMFRQHSPVQAIETFQTQLIEYYRLLQRTG